MYFNINVFFKAKLKVLKREWKRLSHCFVKSFNRSTETAYFLDLIYCFYIYISLSERQINCVPMISTAHQPPNWLIDVLCVIGTDEWFFACFTLLVLCRHDSIPTGSRINSRLYINKGETQVLCKHVTFLWARAVEFRNFHGRELWFEATVCSGWSMSLNKIYQHNTL